MRPILALLVAAALMTFSIAAMAQPANDPCWVAALKKYPDPQHAQTGGAANAGQLASLRQNSYDTCSKGRRSEKGKLELSAEGKKKLTEQKCRSEAAAKYPDPTHAQTGGSQGAAQLADVRQKFFDLCMADSKL